jgi:hypothetical protein
MPKYGGMSARNFTLNVGCRSSSASIMPQDATSPHELDELIAILLKQLIKDSGDHNRLLSSSLKNGSRRKSMFPIITVLDVYESGSPKGGK